MEIEWVPISSLTPNPKNRNKHSDAQIARLAQIIRYQGWRWPIIVSKQSGLIMAGHGRLLAAKELKLTKVPVSRQDFQTEEQAYAFLVSDNAIASWAELDLGGINLDIGDLGPDFEIDLLGIKDFTVMAPDFDPGLLEDQGKLDEKKPVECPSCGEKFVPKA